ncbi:MAG: response regulator [Lachnospiraceae bacterium]|nr:response regulator [Lachnospiraceae bacterium]
MLKKPSKAMKFIHYILSFLVVASFVFFIVMQIVLPKENQNGLTLCKVYPGDWAQINAGGSRTEVTLPVQLECEQGEWIAIETKIPEDLGDTCLGLRSSQQDFKVYVGDELRQEYSTIDTQLFGKTSTITYVWVNLNDEDAGKTMRVDFMSDSFYSGYMEEILCGDKWDIVSYLIAHYGASTLMALLLFLVGLAIVIVCQSVIPIFKFGGNAEMFSLGRVVVMTSTWLLVESKLRQFFFPNSTIAMYMGFLMIMLLPYAFLKYLDYVQKHRYEKVYSLIMLWAIINFVVCTGLQVAGVKDFFETMTSSHILLGVTIVEMLATIICDIKKGLVREYRTVAIGLAGILLAGVIEICLSYVVNAKLNGVPLCVSLIGLVCMAGIKVGKEMTSIESEKQTAIAARRSQALFLANMSHEIRTPINTILGMNEMILREEDDKTILGYSKHIKRAGHMLLGLINEILDFSKIEAGKLEIVPVEYSLQSLLEDVKEDMQKQAREKRITFIAEIENGLPARLKGDELRVKQILNNLLSNAVKYTHEGRITFSVRSIKQEDAFKLFIAVKDTGVGIKEEDIDHLFDSFQRLELEKNRHIQGTGLGLCITKQLVDEMGGSIKVSSVYGEGTCFEVLLPQEVVAMTEEGLTESQTERAEGEFFRAPDAQVLGVDDNRVNLKVLKALLKRSEVKLDLAISGKQALERTREKKYDLILMDHMMPEMDGIETMHIIRKEKDNPNCDTKIIALTANAIQGAEQEYLKEGFDNYISKPIDPDRLEFILEKYL